MADYFGYSKNTQGPGTVASANMVLFSIASNGDVKLAQDCQIQYQRQTQFVYELGSSTVYNVAGPSSGSASISRAVGVTKLLEPYKPSGACSTDTLNISNGDVTCSADVGTITCEGCLLTSVGMQTSASGLIVTDSAQWTVASLSN